MTMNPYWNTSEIRRHLQIDDRGGCLDMPTYAQLEQDRSVVTLFGGRTGGYYVDVGAHDGISFSNTYLLERKYQWSGICVEPMPDNFARLVKNRPHSKCSEKAVFHTSGLSVEFAQADMFSGIRSHIDCHNEGLMGSVIQVETITMTDLLKMYEAPQYIEYLSIDTEGSELEVLKSIDFETYRFGLIHIEHNFIEPRRRIMHDLLQSKGYRFTRENRWDDEYLGEIHP